MIKSFEITNHLGETITLELANPYTTGLAIESVKGLEPAKADIKTTEIVTMDGSIFNNARTSKRNIVFKFIFLDAPTIEETRERCYRYFPVKEKITIKIVTDRKTLQTIGYVESNEVTIFSKGNSKSSNKVEFKSGSQVSVICPSSYFSDAEPTTTELTCMDKTFDFPSGSLIDYSDDEKIKNITSDPIEFGSIKNKREMVINYSGEIDTGFLLNIHLLGPVGNLILYDLTTNETMTIYTDLICYYLGYSQLQSGDDIYISTVKGNKYIYFSRNCMSYNIMSCIDINSDWFQLRRGYNRLGLKTSTGYENVVLNVTNDVLFGGV